MSISASTPSGMLNAYIHESHTPVEEFLASDSQAKRDQDDLHGAPQSQTTSANKEARAVSDLDKCMRQKTDPPLLKIAHEGQNRKCSLLVPRVVIGLGLAMLTTSQASMKK